jgi:hypothetical protein
MEGVKEWRTIEDVKVEKSKSDDLLLHGSGFNKGDDFSSRLRLL